MSSDTALVFLIDRTTSMGPWIRAVTAALPSLVHSVAATGTFTHAAILTYADYDLCRRRVPLPVCTFSGYHRTTDPDAVTALEGFSSAIKCEGGGGIPEAVKTALSVLASYPLPAARMHVLHLTDAPPHAEPKLDKEGVEEKAALDAMWPWDTLVKRLSEAHPTLQYTALTTRLHPLYCSLALATGGDVWRMVGGTSVGNIRAQIGTVLNAWLGVGAARRGPHRLTAPRFSDAYRALRNTPKSFAASVADGLPLVAQDDDDESTEGLFGIPEARLSAEAVAEEGDVASVPCPVVSAALRRSMAALEKDPQCKDRLFVEMSRILDIDCMALTISPLVGKLWRRLCRARDDPRRDDLLAVLNRARAKLPYPDASVMEEWLKASFDDASEIRATLQAFMRRNETAGLLRFAPEGESFSAQQMVSLLARGDRDSVVQLRALLGRFFIDHAATIPSMDAGSKSDAQGMDSDDDEAVDATPLPLPPNALPFNLPRAVLFSLALHTVAPGTQLARRYAALLAAYAVQCGCVLADAGRGYLQAIKGTWIDWGRRDDGTAIVPENYAGTFLSLVLHPEVAPSALTADELKQAQHIRAVSRALAFHRGIEIRVEVSDDTSADAVLPDHGMVCSACTKLRPLSLMNEEGVCGYCLADDLEQPPMDETAQLQVRCSACGAFYARDKAVQITERSKCHGCKAGAPSPTVECTTCGLHVVQYYHPERGLPKGGQCGPCAGGHPPRAVGVKEHYALAHQVFVDEDHFDRLAARLRLRRNAEAADRSVNAATPIVDAAWIYEPFPRHSGDDDEEEPRLPSDGDVPATDVLFRGQRPVNAAALWDIVATTMAHGVHADADNECSMCMMPPPKGERLVRACGRHGCAQRVCAPCCRRWYGVNKPGALILPRATLCQFCARPPAPTVVRLASRRVGALVALLRREPLAQDSYYGWCQTCLRPSHVADRACTAGAVPEIADFECPTCVAEKCALHVGHDPALSRAAKPCPKCNSLTIKDSGCHHMECPVCAIHWCWECGEFQSTDADEVYSHMAAHHGGMWDYSGADTSDDEDWD